MKYTPRSKNNTGLMISLVVGAAAGAAIAFFFTSEQGREMIDDVKDAAAKAEEDVRDAIAKLEDKISQGKEIAASFEKKSGNLFKKFTS